MDNNAIPEYVTTHIDEAIANEWIKVYYQPVVRSLTGQLCSAESLTRWIDNEIGFIAPNIFVAALEDKKLIHKLDCFVVDRVCHDIHDRLSNSLPTVPVSINMSRLDFIMCDMLKVVEDAVEKYNIPRDYLHVEITESMIVQDEDLMIDVISKFRARGYEIWMDDFGSGYSSLTLLKDYEFDLLKMDMRFLSSMNDKAKTLVRYTTGMAKRIGIKTLCEGVETLEQVEFLKSVGCGKLQGYYYSKPLPLEEMLETIEKKGISIEERQWKSFYEVASITVHDTDVPLAIFEYNDGNLQTYFMNNAFIEQIGTRTTDLKRIDAMLFHPGSDALKKYASYAKKAIASKNQESFYYTSRGIYFQLKIIVVAENEGRYLIKGTVNDISHEEDSDEKSRLDTRFRELNNLYESVALVNFKECRIHPLLGSFIYLSEEQVTGLDLNESIEFFSEHFIYPDDRLKYKEFLNIGSPEARNTFPSREFVKTCVRIKQDDGSYEWREVALLSIPGTDNNEFLFAGAKVADEIARALDASSYSHFSGTHNDSDSITKEYARIWDNLVNNSSYKLFWKDKDRRFRGVSKSFLDFYEIKSLDDIIGKNDEEMHWHVDDGPYQGDELDVLAHGKVVNNAQGQCIVNGVVHDIICNKMPIYENGKIVGLVGTFEDMDQEVFRVQKLLNPSRVDSITRLMNSKSFLNVMVDYSAQYNEEGRNYGYIVLHNANHRRLENTYGNKFGAKVLKEIAEKIIEITGQVGVASRVKESYFCVILYEDSMDKLKELAMKLKDNIEGINKIDGNSVTLKMTTVYHLRSEEGISDESIHMISINEIEKLEAN